MPAGGEPPTLPVGEVLGGSVEVLAEGDAALQCLRRQLHPLQQTQRHSLQGVLWPRLTDKVDAGWFHYTYMLHGTVYVVLQNVHTLIYSAMLCYLCTEYFH